MKLGLAWLGGVGLLFGVIVSGATAYPPIGSLAALGIGTDVNEDIDPNGYGGRRVEDGAEPPQFAGGIQPGVDDLGEALVFENARFAIGSVALRDCRAGGINITGIPAGSTILRAYLYWQWACLDTAIEGEHDTMRFLRVFPTPRVELGFVEGTLVGTGPNPCWCSPSYSNYNYRADVTAAISSDRGGYYGVITAGGAAGSVGYRDPWSSALFSGCARVPEPLLNGAALVVVYTSECEPNGTVVLYDSGIAGTMFTPIPGYSYTLNHPVAPGTEARFAMAAGDGQVGFGYLPFFGFPSETTTINALQVAGPGTLYNDSDWNGSAGKPLPQLFETTGHDITAAVTPGATSTTVTFSAVGAGLSDCVTPSVNVLLLR